MDKAKNIVEYSDEPLLFGLSRYEDTPSGVDQDIAWNRLDRVIDDLYGDVKSLQAVGGLGSLVDCGTF